MEFRSFGKEDAPVVILIPGLGVSYEIFEPLIGLLKDRYRVVAVEVDGFILGKHSRFTSIDHQAEQLATYITKHLGGQAKCIYGLSLGGKILSRLLERGEVVVEHAIMDAAPLLPLPRWLVAPLSHTQCLNVWTCYHWTGFWRRVFHSHYFDVLLDECRKVYPYGGNRAVLDGYKSVYTNKLHSVCDTDIHYWYGTKEAFAARPQAKHLKELHPALHIEVFRSMNHGQLLIETPTEVAKRITQILGESPIE